MTPEFTVDTTVGRTVLIESVWSCDLALVILTHSLFSIACLMTRRISRALWFEFYLYV